MPLLAIFWRGFSCEAGQGGGLVAARELVTSENFHWLLGNSLKVSLSVAAIVVPLAYLFAYALQRTLIPAKGLWRGISLLPLMAPSMLPAIALVYLFGNQGLLRGLLIGQHLRLLGHRAGRGHLHLPACADDSAVSPVPGRCAPVRRRFQHGRQSWRKRFRSITWPATRQAVFAAFCLVFTLTITDFGVPGGGRRRLSGAGAGSLQSCGRPAAVRPRRIDRHGLAAAGAVQFRRRCLVAPTSRRVHEWTCASVQAHAVALPRWLLPGHRAC